MNTIPAVWGMNITKSNEMYVPPVYGANYGTSMYNDVEKTYPHPYTVSFTFDGSAYKLGFEIRKCWLKQRHLIGQGSLSRSFWRRLTYWPMT